MGFGRYNSFPFRFGAGKTAKRAIHQALLDRYSPVFDTDDSKLPAMEAYAEAQIASQAWYAAERVGNQLQPTKMLENLPVWEEACGLRIGLDDTDRERSTEAFAQSIRDDLVYLMAGRMGKAEEEAKAAFNAMSESERAAYLGETLKENGIAFDMLTTPAQQMFQPAVTVQPTAVDSATGLGTWTLAIDRSRYATAGTYYDGVQVTPQSFASQGTYALTVTFTQT